MWLKCFNFRDSLLTTSPNSSLVSKAGLWNSGLTFPQKEGIMPVPRLAAMTA